MLPEITGVCVISLPSAEMIMVLPAAQSSAVDRVVLPAG